MSNDDDDTEGLRRRGRSPGGDSEWSPLSGQDTSQRGGGVPGKRSLTQGIHAADPRAVLLAKVRTVRGQISGVREHDLPAMNTAIEARDMNAARDAAARLGIALGTVDRELHEVCSLATLLSSPGARTIVDELATEAADLHSGADPVLELAPPAAPSIPALAAFAVHLFLDDLAANDATEAEQRRQWLARLDARDRRQTTGGTVIDASRRFAGGNPGRASATIDKPPEYEETRGTIDDSRHVADRAEAKHDAAQPDHPRLDRAAAMIDKPPAYEETRTTIDDSTAAEARGQSVPAALRNRLEAAAGASLSGVRVHEGPSAHALASSYDARAVTIGQDIHFAEGELDSDDRDAEHLLAHEVAHTIQQRAGEAAPACKPDTAMAPSDPAEVEADRFADAFVAGRPTSPILQSLGGVPALKRRSSSPTPDADLDRQPAPLLIDPDRLRFPRTAVGAEAPTQTVTITNAGADPVGIEDVAVTPSNLSSVFPTYAPDASINDPIAAGGSVDLQFAFRPSTVGDQSTSYSIITDGRVRSGVVQLEGTGFSNDRSETPKLDASPKRVKMSPTGLGEESAPVTLELTNTGAQPVTIEQLDIRPARKTSESEFTIYGEGGKAIEPGESTRLHVGFRPEQTGLRRAHLDVIGNQGAKLASVSLKGKGLSRTDARYQDALHGDVTATSTYDDMLAALLAAAKFTELGDEASYRRAHDVLDPVIDRMGDLAPKMEAILKKYGVANMAGLTMFGEAHWAVKEWWYKLDLGSSINTDHYVTVFRAGEEEIKLGTSEIKESNDLRALQDAGETSAKVVGVVSAAAVLVPLAAAAAPALLAEGALMWESAGWLGSRLGVWALANPEAAIVLSETLLGTGIQIGEGGWDSFAEQFKSGEGMFFWLMQVLMDGGQLAQASDAGGAKPRATQDGADDVTPPARAPASDGAPGAKPSTGGKGKPADAGAQSSREVSPEAAELAASVVTKAKAAIEEIGTAVSGKRGETQATTPQDTKSIDRVRALDPDEGERLIKEYGDELTEYLNWNPLTNLQDLEKALSKQRGRVKERVAGFYEGIDPNTPPDGWVFKSTESVESASKIKVIKTEVQGPNGAVGYFERAYDPRNRELELRYAFLKLSGEEVAVPSIVPKQGSAAEMVDGKGSPTVQYITLYQMKKLGVPLGDAAIPGVEKIHMSDIQNVETIVHLQWLRDNVGGDASDLIEHTASVQYAETTAIQTGYERAAPPLVLGGKEKPIREVLEHQEGGNAERVTENNEVLEKYGYDRDAVMLWGFEIDFLVRPRP